MDTTKERVEQELEELSEKISKLAAFLYGKKSLDANLSDKMLYEMEQQFYSMCGYARSLQTRLKIWGKSNEELDKGLINNILG